MLEQQVCNGFRFTINHVERCVAKAENIALRKKYSQKCRKKWIECKLHKLYCPFPQKYRSSLAIDNKEYQKKHTTNHGYSPNDPFAATTAPTLFFYFHMQHEVVCVHRSPLPCGECHGSVWWVKSVDSRFDFASTLTNKQRWSSQRFRVFQYSKSNIKSTKFNSVLSYFLLPQ